jgi:4-hydroxy-4-methyl-2-oxoglutarate aldolase
MKMGTVIRNIPRSSTEQLKELSSTGVATVHEAMGRTGLMKPYMRPIYKGGRIAGNAITVLAHPGHNLMLHVAVELCQPGDVVVVAMSADDSHGMFGVELRDSLSTRVYGMSKN